jgi:predicted dehydrogenase
LKSEKNTYKVGIIGYGYWGPNLARNIFDHNYFSLFAIADKDVSKRKKAKKQYPNINIFNDAFSLIDSEEIEAVVIATSVNQHYKIAKTALEKGKHVLLEKPACASYNQLLELKNIALENKVVLMVDYTFLYNGAVLKLKNIISSNDFGKLNYIDSTRINLGIFQTDINVLWDLASHDVAIVNYFIEENPSSVIATGISHTKNGIENIAYMDLKYENKNLIVHINCSWSSPVKIRQMLIGGDKKMVIYNDIEPTDKIKVYDCDFNIENDDVRKEVLVDYRLGDISIPKFETKEALAFLTEDFYEAIKTGNLPKSSIDFALKVSKIIEAAQKSLKNNSINVDIEW